MKLWTQPIVTHCCATFMIYRILNIKNMVFISKKYNLIENTHIVSVTVKTKGLALDRVHNSAGHSIAFLHFLTL